LKRLWENLELKEWIVQSTVWQWVVAMRSTKKTQKQSPDSQWEGDGDTHPDYTLISSETPGELDMNKIRHSGI